MQATDGHASSGRFRRVPGRCGTDQLVQVAIAREVAVAAEVDAGHVAIAAHQAVVKGAAVQHVVAAVAQQRVVAVAAVQHVTAGAANDLVIAVAAQDGVVELVAGEDVVPGGTFQAGLVGGQREGVVAGSTGVEVFVGNLVCLGDGGQRVAEAVGVAEFYRELRYRHFKRIERVGVVAEVTNAIDAQLDGQVSEDQLQELGAYQVVRAVDGALGGVDRIDREATLSLRDLAELEVVAQRADDRFAKAGCHLHADGLGRELEGLLEMGIDNQVRPGADITEGDVERTDIELVVEFEEVVGNMGGLGTDDAQQAEFATDEVAALRGRADGAECLPCDRRCRAFGLGRVWQAHGQGAEVGIDLGGAGAALDRLAIQDGGDHLANVKEVLPRELGAQRNMERVLCSIERRFEVPSIITRYLGAEVDEASRSDIQAELQRALGKIEPGALHVQRTLIPVRGIDVAAGIPGVRAV